MSEHGGIFGNWKRQDGKFSGLPIFIIQLSYTVRIPIL